MQYDHWRSRKVIFIFKNHSFLRYIFFVKIWSYQNFVWMQHNMKSEFGSWSQGFIYSLAQQMLSVVKDIYIILSKWKCRLNSSYPTGLVFYNTKQHKIVYYYFEIRKRVPIPVLSTSSISSLPLKQIKYYILKFRPWKHNQ